MAFYAELLRRRWYCVCEENWIQFYRKFTYDTWYASLTASQKEQVRLAEEKSARRDE